MTLQELCELGQEHLMRMQYLRAEAALVQAEAMALREGDWDTLARLYMPLQEARRQRRVRCGEGVVCLDLIARGPQDRVDGRRVVENYPHGQLLVAGWGTIEPALTVRQLAQENDLYVEVFLGAVYPLEAGHAVVIAPLPDVVLPEPSPRSIEEVVCLAPAHSIVLNCCELPRGSCRGDGRTFSRTMELWERLHKPFLAQADSTRDPVRRIDAYRATTEVDYACELAHQKLSDTARQLARTRGTTRPGS